MPDSFTTHSLGILGPSPAPITVQPKTGHSIIVVVNVYVHFQNVFHINIPEVQISAAIFDTFSKKKKIPTQTSIFLFTWGFTSFSTLYRSYHDG